MVIWGVVGLIVAAIVLPLCATVGALLTIGLIWSLFDELAEDISKHIDEDDK